MHTYIHTYIHHILQKLNRSYVLNLLPEAWVAGVGLDRSKSCAPPPTR